MNVLTSNASVSELKTPLLAVPVTAGDSRGGAFAAADAATQGRLSAIADEESYKGKPGTTLLVHTSDLGARRMLLVGIGKADGLEVTTARSLAATAVRAANARHLDGATVLMPAEMNGASAAAMATQGAVLGGAAETKREGRHLRSSERTELKDVVVHIIGRRQRRSTTEGQLGSPERLIISGERSPSKARRPCIRQWNAPGRRIEVNV